MHKGTRTYIDEGFSEFSQKDNNYRWGGVYRESRGEALC